MEGNQMSNSFDKMHDALVKLRQYMRYETCSKSFCIDSLDLDAFKVIQSALDLPRRNCDVGTAEEQVKRFEKYCGECTGSRCDHRLFEDDDKEYCALEWGQMPYAAQEGGEE